MHVEFLVEEESCRAALEELLPKIIGAKVSFRTIAFQGKLDLLQALPDRLHGYGKWIPDDWRIVVLVDRDDDDCKKLKVRLEKVAKDAGLTTRSAPGRRGMFRVLNRIAVEELEAWFFGDVDALAEAYPGLPPTLAARKGFRDPDAIAGGTWEKLERVLKNAGYYRAGMPKIEVARNVSRRMDPSRNQSRSFQVFRDGLQELIA